MKRIILTTVLAGLLGSLVYAQNNSDNNTHITSVKAVSTVCGPGLKAGWSTGGNDIYPGSATVTQIADIKTTKGNTYKASRTGFSGSAGLHTRHTAYAEPWDLSLSSEERI